MIVVVFLFNVRVYVCKKRFWRGNQKGLKETKIYCNLRCTKVRRSLFVFVLFVCVCVCALFISVFVIICVFACFLVMFMCTKTSPFLLTNAYTRAYTSGLRAQEELCEGMASPSQRKSHVQSHAVIDATTQLAHHRFGTVCRAK
jgi:hypothetical protein